jgi:predicted nucleic acid-binding Zn ribbon protein
MTPVERPTFTFKCVGCGAKYDILVSEMHHVEEPPTCKKCFYPMVVEKGKT